MKNMLPYLTVLILCFYLLPLMIQDTGMAMMLLLIVLPSACLVSSCAYGIKNSFHLLYSLMAAMLFVPAVFIFYNKTAWVYSLGYGIIALTGNAIGSIFHKRKKQ